MKRINTLLINILLSMSMLAQPVIIFTSANKENIGEAEFSISETKKVVFAKGNLLYQPSTKKWRIAPRQYDFVGGNNTKDVPLGRHGTIWENGVQCNNTSGNHIRYYTGWLDVFAWGTSGWYGDDLGEDDTKTYTWRLANNPNQKVTCNPYDLGHKDSVCLILGGDEYQGFTGAYVNADWGIRNNEVLGGSTDSVFRTPTKEEFDYLLTERPNARNFSARGHIRLFGIGSAPDTIVNGLILLPDNWNPAILPETPIITDADGNEYYETNEFTAAEWQILEENGAIFLPATGNTSKFNRSGYYWTSTSWKNKSAWNVEFGGYGWNGHESDAQTKAADKSSGRAVRLVMEITTREVVETPSSPITCNDYEKIDVPGHGGTITSVQNPLDHCIWEIEAIPGSDYQFAYWNDLHGNKTYANNVEITIDPDITSIVMQAVFVKSNAYIHEWLSDSIVYRADTSDILNGLSTGSSDIYVNNALLQDEICKSDHGVWKQKTNTSFLNNSNAGKRFHLVFYNANNKATAVIDTISPVYIIGTQLASEINFHNEDNADVQVYGTLRIDRNTVINGILDIHCNGKVIIEEGKTLEVKGIIMRGNGITKNWPQLVANGSIINHNNDTIYYDYTLDQHEYYPLALPYTTQCSLVYNPMTGKASSYLSYYYDTDVRSRGEYGWKEYDDLAEGASFEAGKGFSVYAVPMKWKGNRQKEAIMRFPMVVDLTEGEQQKSIPIRCSTFDNGKLIDKNWNLIGNPYLAEFVINVTSDTTKLSPGYYEWNDLIGGYEIINYDKSIRYITYSLDGYRSYEQDILKGFTIKPFNSYFVQTVSGDVLSFIISDRSQNSPSRFRTRELETGILISQEDKVDNTGLLFGNYTDEYEINADLTKEPDNYLSLYTLSNSGNMSFQALSYDNIYKPIYLGCNNLKMTSAIISFDDSRYNRFDLKALWLIDKLLNKKVNLLEENYLFIPESTQENNRFILNIELLQDISTDIQDTKNMTEEHIFDILGNKVNVVSSNGVYIIINNNERKKYLKYD